MVKLPSDEDDKKLVIAAIGEAGEGKSTLLNLILNSPGEDEIFFDVSDEPEACTISPTYREGIWRGDPSRPVIVIDTPGLCSEDRDDDPDCDHTIASEIVKILNKFGHINAFIIVLKSGQSRFLSQHQHMFQTFQEVFGAKFWKNSIIDVSHNCDARSRKKVEAWLEKLANKFPGAADAVPDKVFIDAPEMDHDTLEDLYFLCRSKEEFICSDFHSVKKEEQERMSKQHQINSSLEDLSQSSDCISGSENFDRLRISTDFDHSRPQSRSAFNNSYDCSRPSSRSSMFLEVPKTFSRSEMNLHRPTSRTDLSLSLPPLPPRSPTLPSRRRTLPSPTYTSTRSLTSTPRLPRAFLPSFSPTEELSYSSLSSMSPSLSRLSRRSLRDTSPGFSRTFSRETSPISYSCRNSRESSPSPSNKPNYPTIGLPTYLRTSYAHKFPFTKAMRSGRLITKMAVENEVELEPCPGIIPSLPDCQHARLCKTSLDQDLVRSATEQISFERFREAPEFVIKHPERFTAARHVQQNYFENVANENVNIHYLETYDDFTVTQVEKFKARKTSEPKLELELFKPESLVAKNPFTLIKKALLPKIKYHWDQGFAQGKNGWQKCPIIKLKIKYNEEDQDLLPPSVSVEGGRHCETKRVKLDGGKAKLKLKTSEVVDVSLRVVPLDKHGRQEAWVPEFLFTVVKEAVEERKEGEKWRKAIVTPAMPE